MDNGSDIVSFLVTALSQKDMEGMVYLLQLKKGLCRGFEDGPTRPMVLALLTDFREFAELS